MPLQSAVQRKSWSQVQHIEAALTTEGFFATAGTATLLPLPCVRTTYSKGWVRHDVQCVCAGQISNISCNRNDLQARNRPWPGVIGGMLMATRPRRASW